MSEKNFLHKAWSEMSTAQLDEKLQQELQKEYPEEGVVLGIMRVIQEREADYSEEITDDVCDAWEKYSERIVSPKKNSQKRMWFVSVAAAAIICIVIMAIPQTVGAESILDVFFRWTESVFEFFMPGQELPKPSSEYVFQTDHPGLQQVYDKVTELGVTKPVVPMWIPEDYVLTELKSTQMPSCSRMYVTFRLNDSSIMLSYQISGEIMPILYEKEEHAVEAYEYANVCHFIMANDENILVTWRTDNTECSISVTLQKDDVYKIIKSIYKGGLS